MGNEKMPQSFENKSGSKNESGVGYFQEKYGQKVMQQIEFIPENQKQKELLEFFDERLVGQKQAKEMIAESITGALNSSFQKKGPIATFFFHGPTGVGKTDIAHILAEFCFGDKNALVKLKCEQMTQEHEGSVIKGAPPGFLGFDKSPRITQEILDGFYVEARNRQKLHPLIASIQGFNIVVLDEVEKMHPKINQEFLGILDDGNMVTQNGKMVDFSNTIFIFTSNLGQKQIKELSSKSGIGFVAQDTTSDRKNILKKAFNDHFSPEFLGRIHHFVEFDQLLKEDALKILDIQLSKFNEDIEKYYKERPGLSVDISPRLKDLIIESGFSGEAGARDLVRTFEKHIAQKISGLFLSESFASIMNSQDPVVVGLDAEMIDSIQYFIFSAQPIKVEKIRTIQLPVGFEGVEILIGKMTQFSELFYLQQSEGIDYSQELSELKEDFIKMGISHSDIDRLKGKTYLKMLYENQFIHDFEGILDYSDVGAFAPFGILNIKKIVEHKLNRIVPKQRKNIHTNVLSQACTEIFDLISGILHVKNMTITQKQSVLMLIQKHLQEKFNITFTEA